MLLTIAEKVCDASVQGSALYPGRLMKMSNNFYSWELFQDGSTISISARLPTIGDMRRYISILCFVLYHFIVAPFSPHSKLAYEAETAYADFLNLIRLDRDLELICNRSHCRAIRLRCSLPLKQRLGDSRPSS